MFLLIVNIIFSRHLSKATTKKNRLSTKSKNFLHSGVSNLTPEISDYKPGKMSV